MRSPAGSGVATARPTGPGNFAAPGSFPIRPPRHRSADPRVESLTRARSAAGPKLAAPRW